MHEVNGKSASAVGLLLVPFDLPGLEGEKGGNHVH
jgi:hypothetical protein